jgi:hypothetical protein
VTTISETDIAAFRAFGRYDLGFGETLSDIRSLNAMTVLLSRCSVTMKLSIQLIPWSWITRDNLGSGLRDGIFR